jgi:hypothetical protein
VTGVVGGTGAGGPPRTGGKPAGGGGAGAGGARAAAAPRRGKTPPGSHGQKASKGGSPIVRTVERIVSVVPPFVWALVGVLGLLSLALAASSWLAALRARRLARQRRRLADDVGLLQAALLPVVPALIGPLRTSVAYRPAEGPAAGGDFYDLFALEDGRVAVIVGDVSGHGRAALPQTALIRYTMRAYLDTGLPPRAALHAAAGALEHQLGHDTFATAALAIYDPSMRSLTYACAGHPPPLIMDPHPLEPVLVSASPPIGLGLATGRRQTVLSLPGAAQACFFTDGVVEARTGGQLFGTDRLAGALTALGAGATAEALLGRVVAATDRRPDDMAACLLGLDGAPTPASTRSEELELDRAELTSGRAEHFLAACGLDADEIKLTLQRARATVDRAGAAILRLHFGQGRPQVEVEQPLGSVLHEGGAQIGTAALGSSSLV